MSYKTVTQTASKINPLYWAWLFAAVGLLSAYFLAGCNSAASSSTLSTPSFTIQCGGSDTSCV